MELAGIPLVVWGGFMAFVFAMLALDLGVFHRESHEIRMREALTWTGIWIGIALLFNLGIFLFWDRIGASSGYTAKEAGLAFLAGYLVEKALSVDNIFVFLIVFTYFQVPAKYQHRVLFWGIIGALLFRAIFIAAGSALLERFFWMMIVFGVFLIATGIKMAVLHDKKIEPEKNPLIRLVRRLIPVTPGYVGQKFFTRIDGKLWATPLLVCLIFIELTDVIFAVDSIPAIFAITSNPFIVFTSNVFAILGLRALFFALAGLLQLFHYLSYGLAAILVFVGGKMLYNYYEKAVVPELSKFPVALSLGIIVAILAVSILASIKWGPKPAPGNLVRSLPSEQG
ncbi:MAG: putative membrane-bound redox modulator Alx [Fimbriimonadaceae bacterium]|nr:putative membrane-bound redox modulator Alx [Fimbriimonadaceae bacterium]